MYFPQKFIQRRLQQNEVQASAFLSEENGVISNVSTMFGKKYQRQYIKI